MEGKRVYTLSEIEAKYKAIERELSDPSVAADKSRYAELAKEFTGVSRLLQAEKRLHEIDREIGEYEGLRESSDEALKGEIEAEIERLERERDAERRKKMLSLLPEDPMDGRNILMEIRAGTGGGEAALFAADLFRMYSRFCERKGWKTEILSGSETGIGGFKEIVFSISGKGAYRALKFEMGVHRVQRIPVTEASGRIHTSAVTVAVLPEARETDIRISPDDLRIDVYRSQGHGGQSVNTTDSAVRVTHVPTGVVVTCQDEKSQHKNKEKALKVLRARLYEMAERERKETEDRERKSQIGSGDRSERIRTYNFPQNRVTDHRVGLTLYKLDRIIEGDLDEILGFLAESDARKQLESLGSGKGGG
jgi:peptide chain release factor 1